MNFIILLFIIPFIAIAAYKTRVFTHILQNQSVCIEREHYERKHCERYEREHCKDCRTAFEGYRRRHSVGCVLRRKRDGIDWLHYQGWRRHRVL